MARINLLPWRENLRQERQRNFMVSLGITAVAAIVLVMIGNHLVNRQISAQDTRNSYLNSQIRQLERDIQEIEDLERRRESLIARKDVIERLQENRSMTVHLFNYMARTAPDGVRLTSLRQTGEELTILGTTQSETRVSEYMRNIEGADWLHDPSLRIVEVLGQRDLPDQPFRFELRARIASPAVNNEES